jgi:AcrR family transcriptional regulator
MTFGKPGRPPEDRFARQCEIYAAVSPLLLTVGARQLSMRQAARAACMSVGGVYHYFPTKRALLLHGVQEETLDRLCHDYFEQLVPLAATDPQGYLDAYQAAMVRAVLFVRPAVYAALTLGDAAFQSAVEATLSPRLDALIALLSPVGVSGPDSELQALAHGLRQACLGALLDPSVSEQEIGLVISVFVDGSRRRLAQTPSVG